MNGNKYMASRFAATLRRQLYKGANSLLTLTRSDIAQYTYSRPSLFRSEHLGLIPPQTCDSRHEQVTPFMLPAPTPNEDDTQTEEDFRVADPLSDETVDLLDNTARKNREIFTELFRPVPSNLVRDWKGYQVGHHLGRLASMRLTIANLSELCAEGKDRTCCPRGAFGQSQAAFVGSQGIRG